MELARQRYPRLHLPTIALGIQLPVRIRFAVGLWLGFLVMIFIVLLLKPFAPPPNPLSAYADLLPGQTASDLEMRGFQCGTLHIDRYHFQVAASHFCSYRPPKANFERIEVMLSTSNTIQVVTFTLRPNGLQSGDLALLWGRPPVITTDRGPMTLLWDDPGGIVLANTNGSRFSYQMPVYRVMFMSAS